MTRKPKGREPAPLIYPDSVRPPQKLPDAESVLKIGFRLTAQETTEIRMAMAIHTASKQPKLTWTGWWHIAIAVAIGAEHVKKAAGGRTDTPLYIRAMSEFLKKTGFIFLNKDDRAAAVRMLPRWDEIDDWRSSLPRSQQQRLNNPREVWQAYVEHRRKLGDPEAKPRPSTRSRREFPTWAEQMEALEQQKLLSDERAERCERESEYFAAMVQEIIQQAKLSEDEVSEIRARVRAAYEAEVPDEEDTA